MNGDRARADVMSGQIIATVRTVMREDIHPALMAEVGRRVAITVGDLLPAMVEQAVDRRIDRRIAELFELSQRHQEAPR